MSYNAITDIGALVGLESLRLVDLRGNPLDLTLGSETLEHVQFLRERGVEVLVDGE